MESHRNFECRRALVYRLLKEGTGDKMFANRSANAVATLRLAYQKAREPEDLYPPLPQVAAYRLANALFRSARTKKDLEKINSLLMEATNDDKSALGPMPYIHRVAVLSRLQAVDSQNQTLKAQAESAYEAACNLARRDEMVAYRSNRTFVEAQIQGQLHNILELTAYFTGFEYERRVAGLFSPFEDLRLKDEWTIVGTDGVSESVVYPEELAVIELQAREKAGIDLLFKLGPPKNRSKHDVWVRESRVKGRYGRYPLLMLAALCRRPCTDEQLFSAAHGDTDFNSAALASDKKDLRAMLEECLKRPRMELLPEQDLGQPLQLASGLKIAGMVFVGAGGHE